MENAEEQQNTNKHKWRNRFIAGAIILVLMIIGLSSMGGNKDNPKNENQSVKEDNQQTTEAPKTSVMQLGDEGYLRLPNNNDPTQVICLGETKDDYDKINKALLAKDYLGLLEIPGAFCVSNGTKILLIDKDFASRKVRVVQGVRDVDKDKVGRAGWIVYEWVVAQ